MLKIGICDEDKQFINYLQDLLSTILFQYTDWETEIFESSEDIIRAIDSGEFDCTLLFMEIFLKSTSGVNVAKYVNEHHIDTDIIFITSSQDYVFECYRYHTFAYLLKPLQQKEIEFEMRRYLEELEKSPKCLNISQKGNIVRIPIRSILYVESNYRKLIVHTRKKDYEYYEKIGVVDEVLKDEGFIRCHQSYLVAKDKVTTYSGNEMEIDGIRIPISRRYMEEVRKQFEYIDEKVLAANKTVSTSLARNQRKTGALVCVQGAYVGAIIRFHPEQKILVGRDKGISDLVIELPMVSRLHCTLIYHEESNEYEIIDCSSNGTFVNGDKRLVRNEKYILKPGTTVSFGDQKTVYKLG